MLSYICLIIIIVAYTYLYLKPKTDFQILQANLNNITDDLLYEKYPIILHDQIVNLDDIVSSTFRYQYVFKKDKVVEKESEMCNRHKYMILQNVQTEECSLEIMSPKKTVNTSIIIPSFNVVIIPYKWCIKDNTFPLKCILLDDLIHGLVNIHVN